MKKRMVKMLCCVITVIMVAGLAACGQATPKTATDETAANAVTPATTAATTTAKAEPTKLSFWHIWSQESSAVKLPITNALEELKKSHPEIVVEDEASDDASFKVKIKTAVAANEAPDLFYSWVPGFTSPFVNAGKILCLDNYLNDGIKDKLLTGALGNVTYDGKVYGLPADIWLGIMFYNTELFKQNGIEIPDTFDELVNVIKAFKAKGITPMAFGLKDKWFAGQFHDALVIRTMGIDAAVNAIHKNDKFTSPAFIDSAKKLVELVDAGAFPQGFEGLSYEELGNVFKQGKAAMSYDGSWMAAAWEADDSPIKGKFVCKAFPSISTDPQGIGGGSSGTFVVSANTKNPDAAVTAAKVIAENFSKFSYQDGFGLPSWKVDVDESKLLGVTVQMADVAKASTGYMLNFDTIMEPAVATEYLNFLQDLCSKAITPEEFAKRVQDVVDQN